MRLTKLIRDPSFFFAVTFSAFPILILLFLIHKYAVNIPIGDQWDVIYLFEKYYTNELNFFDLWKQHNEHRLFFPKLIFLGLGILTHYNVLYEIFTSLLLASLIYLLMIWHINKNREFLKIEKKYRWLWMFFSFFIFSLTQYENWLWGFQLQWFLNILAVMVGAFILSNYTLNLFTFSLLACCGIIATFSLSSGILYWIIILFFLIVYAMRIDQKANLFFMLAWIVLSVGVLAAYLYNYHKPAHHPSLLYFLEDPISFAVFIAAYLGAPLAFCGKTISISLGLFGLILFVFFSVQYIPYKYFHELQPRLFFMIIGSYSILCAVLTAVGRAGFGVNFATSSRYTTVSIVLWVSVFFMIYASRIHEQFHSVGYKKAFIRIKTITLVVILVFLNLSSYKSIHSFRNTYAARKCGRDAVLYDTKSDCLSSLYPGPQRLIDFDIPRLKQLRLSVFKDHTTLTVFSNFAQKDWHLEGGWSLEGTYHNVRPPDDLDSSYYFGSWSGSDSTTGTIESNAVAVDAPVLVRMFVTHGPDISNQKVGVRINGDEPFELLCDLNFEHHSWVSCSFDLSPYIGKRFTIFAEDNGLGWGQWVGFAQPVLLNLR